MRAVVAPAAGCDLASPWTCSSRAAISCRTSIRRRWGTRRSPSICPTWRRWVRGRAGRCWRARCPMTTSAGSKAFARGLFALADRFGVALIGGDTTRGPRNLCLTIIGDLPAGTAITRSGAAAGDDVYVSGTLGDAVLALAVLQRPHERFRPTRSRTARRVSRRPEPRVALGRTAARRGDRCARRLRRADRRPWRTFSTRPVSARRSTSRAFRAAPRCDAMLARRPARACALAAFWRAATTTSFASPRRGPRATISPPSRPTSSCRWRASAA